MLVAVVLLLAPLYRVNPSAALTSRALAKALMNSCDLPGMERAWSRSARDNCWQHTAERTTATTVG